jgi:hypothetical protein
MLQEKEETTGGETEMIIEIDRDTKELCAHGLPILCPCCRKPVTAADDLVCAAKGDEVHLFHDSSRCFSRAKEDALEEVGFDVSYGDGSAFVD